MSQYLLSVHYVDGTPATPPEVAEAAFKAVDAFNTELQASGQWVFAGGLCTPDMATVVRIQDGEALITDGPFPESKEQLGGFWVVDVPDLDAALALAEGGSRACGGPVEVRPFQEGPT